MENGPGGLDFPAGAPSGDTAAPGVSSPTAEIIEGRKKRKDAGMSRGPRGEKPSAGVSTLSQNQFAALYSPEVWGRTLAAPGDGLAAVTGSKAWEISEEERKALGVTGSIAAQVYASNDPRSLALALALITVVDIYAIHATKYYLERKAAREEKQKENKS